MTHAVEPEQVAASVLAGKPVDAKAFGISGLDLQPVADRIDRLISPDPAKPRFMREDIPAGWIRLLDMAVSACCWRAAQQEGSALTLIQCKEKFGELRLLFDVVGTAELKNDVTTITTWARTASVGVCGLFGTPGRLMTDDWIIPLSEEAVDLRNCNPREFQHRSRMPSRT
ncbi:hypothetical protein [Paracoccus marcusii]|uniref:hypothetical protein n=1 Tax=Paracoccus marcusii TaxID=59779 RepID=UPI0037359043